MVIWSITLSMFILGNTFVIGQEAIKESLTLKFEQYKLKNGLDVILHVDKSDPIVAVAINYHVGSNREEKGRTGFAHLFEHMMFQRSENVGADQFFKNIQNAGGELNGGTWNDGTLYYEIVPKNALELSLWMESDRMGYMINTVTQNAFVNQQNVVQNEKRQRVDNNPYGHTDYVIGKNLYPDGHPYNWQVIGEMQDLFNATVEDVKTFHQKYYVPNNATLVLAGDFDPVQAKVFIEKYFGEIPKGPDISDLKPMPVTLLETKKLFHEDNFAKTAQLKMVWPTIQQYTTDSYALDFLADILSKGKRAPLYTVLERDKKLTSKPLAYNSKLELAGTFTIQVTANSGISLDSIEKSVFESFALFEKNGITERDMERIKAGLESDFYNGINSVLNKSYKLATYNEYKGDPSYITKEINIIRAVKIEDVIRVYSQYIKGKHYVETSFLPKGQLNLVVTNSVKANVVEENINNATEVKGGKEDKDDYIKTKTKLDRSIMPVPGTDPQVNLPTIWTENLANGMKVLGIEQSELPMVQLSITINGGHMLDDISKMGTANMVSRLMMQGTKNKTPEQLEEEIEMLGAAISIGASNESIRISANTLTRNYKKTLGLIEEMLLEPRWDSEEFDLAKTKIINNLKQKQADPSVISNNAFYKLLYGKNNLLAYDKDGTVETVQNINIDDLKNFYQNYFSPSMANFHIVGNIGKKQVIESLKSLTNRWKAKQVIIPEVKNLPVIDKSSLYFVDMPGAKQSVIQIGYLSLPRTNPDYFPASVMNFKLGGSFSGIVNQILREEKGFTYGARTSFDGTKIVGPFRANSSVRSNATFESIKIFKESMEKYTLGISKEDLDFTKNYLLKSNARRFETLRALLGMLSSISSYNLPLNYIKKEEQIIREMTMESHKALAQKYIIPNKMIYLVVGDAKTQLEPLKELGLGDPVLIKD